MLCINQRKGDSIVIGLPDGRTVLVKVVDIRQQAVKVGVEADPSVPVCRWEVRERRKPTETRHG